jgi:two-component system LytT family sensor kinase
MKKSTVFLLHLGYWLLYCLLFSVMFVLSRSTIQSAFADWDDGLFFAVFAIVNGLISFYVFYLWLVPRYLNSQKVGTFIGLGSGISIAVGLFSTLLMVLVTGIILWLVLNNTKFILLDWEAQLIFTGVFTLLALVNGAIGTIMRGFITWYGDIHLKELEANRTLKTELALIKAQINPHFLFNTLNNIDVLIEHDAKKASLYLNKLSDLLRFVLYETQTDLIPLSLELDHIKKYVELQKLRTTNDNYITLQISGEAEGLKIHPMLIIPFIENAFKFATNKKLNEAIEIELTIKGKQLFFRCKNLFDPEKSSAENHGGLGNHLLRQRLDFLFKEKYTLETLSHKNSYTVNLTLPLK